MELARNSRQYHYLHTMIFILGGIARPPQTRLQPVTRSNSTPFAFLCCSTPGHKAQGGASPGLRLAVATHHSMLGSLLPVWCPLAWLWGCQCNKVREMVLGSSLQFVLPASLPHSSD